MAVTPCLNRLLAADGRCFDVAIDHEGATPEAAMDLLRAGARAR